MSQAKSNSILLSRVLLKMSPDVFCHPVWIGFLSSKRPASQSLIGNLMAAADQYRIRGDVLCACQVLLLCACLQRISRNFASALEAIEQANSLAQEHGLKNALIWSSWGGASVSLAAGDTDRAIDYLSGLYDLADLEDDWVLGNVIDLLKNSLGRKEKASACLDRFQKWLYLWGESPCRSFLNENEFDYLDHQPPSNWSTHDRLSRFAQIWRKLRSSLKSRFHQRRSAADFPSPGKGFCLHNAQAGVLDRPLLSAQPGRSIDLQTEKPITEIETLENNSQESERNLAQDIPGIYPPFATNPGDSASIAVYCLGDFRIYLDNRLIDNWPSRKGLAVFKYLILQHPAAAAKEILMDTIWPDADLEAARRNLHQAIYSIRQTLKIDQPGSHLIDFDNDAYLLNPEINIWRDYEVFELHVNVGNRARQNGDLELAIHEYGIAESLYQGDFMAEDLYESWVQTHRQHLWQTYISIAHQLADYHLSKGNYPATSVLCRRILEMDDCQEGAHRTLMKCFWAQGERHLARSQYHICVRNLQSVLDISPSEETQSLYQSILNGGEVQPRGKVVGQYG